MRKKRMRNEMVYERIKKFRTPVSTGVESGTVYVICDDGSAWVFPSSLTRAFNDLPEEWVECSPIPGSQRAQEKETEE